MQELYLDLRIALFSLAGIFAVLGFFYFPVAQRMSNLSSQTNELEANAKVARAKRDSLVFQMVGIVREFAEYEGSVFAAANSYSNVISVLGTLPSRFPALSANTHYLELMGDVRREHSNLQNIIEQHNRIAAEYNGLRDGPHFAWNPIFQFTDLGPNSYIGSEMFDEFPRIPADPEAPPLKRTAP